MGFATDAIHVGQEPDPATGAIVAPIYQTSTYVQEALGKNKGYDYARTEHPNRRALERTVAQASKAAARPTFLPPAWPAIDAMFRLLRPGDHAILSEAVYGGVYPADDAIPAASFGLEFSFVDTSQSPKPSRGHPPQHAHDLRRDAHQSHHDRHRYRRRRDWPANKCHAGRRQHLPQPVSAAAPSNSARTSSCTP